MQTLEFRAMNTSVLLAAEGQGLAQEGLQSARNFIEMSERRFSRFLPDSELSQLNRSAGQWSFISAEMLDLLTQSLAFYKETNGLFDPSILPDLKRIGYDRSMDEIRARPNVDRPLASTRTPRPALDELEFDLPHSRVRLPRGIELDFGGIAKGWIVEKTAALLGRYADACAVNAGGDMFFSGQPSGETDWTVYVEDPRNPAQMLTEVRVASGAVATSSVGKRTWTQGGEKRHHLIDPRTGESAQSEWLSVTVTASSLVVAEVYAKVLLIGGPPMAESHPEITFLAVDANGQLSDKTCFSRRISGRCASLRRSSLQSSG
jgi:thiamine biosynthesis lipoprotein